MKRKLGGAHYVLEPCYCINRNGDDIDMHNTYLVVVGQGWLFSFDVHTQPADTFKERL